MLSKYLSKLKSVNPKKYLVVLATIGVAGAGVSSGLNQKSPEVSKQKIVAVSKVLSPTQTQRDQLMPNRTCCSSANSTYLNFYRPLLQRSSDFVPDKAYLGSLLKRGLETTFHDDQTKVLEVYGLSTYWDTSGSVSKLKALLAEGYPTVVNLLHRGTYNPNGRSFLRGGHCVIVRAYEPGKGFFVSDSYGSLLANYSDGKQLDNYWIDEKQFLARWQSGSRYLKTSQKGALGL